jgi:hypothetical protein
MTDDERDEAGAILGRAMLSFVATHFSEESRQQEQTRLWEIMAMELTDAEFDRFGHLTGWQPPFTIIEAPPYSPAELPDGLADDIPF